MFTISVIWIVSAVFVSTHIERMLNDGKPVHPVAIGVAIAASPILLAYAIFIFLRHAATRVLKGNDTE